MIVILCVLYPILIITLMWAIRIGIYPEFIEVHIFGLFKFRAKIKQKRSVTHRKGTKRTRKKRK